MGRHLYRLVVGLLALLCLGVLILLVVKTAPFSILLLASLVAVASVGVIAYGLGLIIVGDDPWGEDA